MQETIFNKLEKIQINIHYFMPLFNKSKHLYIYCFENFAYSSTAIHQYNNPLHIYQSQNHKLHKTHTDSFVIHLKKYQKYICNMIMLAFSYLSYRSG